MLRLTQRLGRQLARTPRVLGAVLFLAWYGVIFLLSSRSQPVTGMQAVPGFFWNLAHAPLFGLLALFAVLARPRRAEGSVFSGAGGTLVALVAVLGLLDEIHQATIPGRDFSVLDVVTDASGALALIWALAYSARPGASDRGLGMRILWGLVLCASAAGAATLVPAALPGVSWF